LGVIDLLQQVKQVKFMCFSEAWKNIKKVKIVLDHQLITKVLSVWISASQANSLNKFPEVPKKNCRV
jgi:hypothetical protein